MLRGAGLFDETHAAMHLDAQRRHFHGRLGRETLDDRHQVFIEGAVAGAHLGVGMMRALVVRSGRHVGNGAGRFGQRPHGQQHALDIGVVRNRHRRGRSLDGAPLHAFARVSLRMLIGTLRHADTLLADRIARGIHHDEHVFQAAVGLAHQIAHRALAHLALARAVQQHRGRTAVDAQLVLQRGAPSHRCALPREPSSLTRYLGTMNSEIP